MRFMEIRERDEGVLVWYKRLFLYLNSIKTKLILSFMLVTLLPLIYVGSVLLRDATRQLLNVVMSNSMAHARKASIDINRYISRQVEILNSLKFSEPALSRNIEDLLALACEYDARSIDSDKLYMLGINGRILMESNQNPPACVMDTEEIGHYLERLETAAFLIKTRCDTEPYVSIVTSVKCHEEIVYGLLVLELNRLQLSVILSENVVGSSTRLYLLDEKNEVIMTFPENGRDCDYPIIERHVDTFNYGFFSVAGPALERPILSAFLPVVGYGWKVINIQDQGEVYAVIDNFRRNLYLILLITMAVAITVAMVISQNIAFPILKLARGADELAGGNLETRITIPNTDEVGQLAMNFNFMADSLRERMEELRDAYDELQIKARTIEKTNRDLDRKVFEITTLYKVGRLMSGVGIDLKLLVDEIIDSAVEAARASRGSLMLLDDNQEFLRLKRVRRWDEDAGKMVSLEGFKENISIRPGEGIAGRVLQTGEMLIINNTEDDGNFKRYVECGRDIRQLCCVPLTVNKVTFGVINIVNRRDGKSFDQKDTGLLQTLASQAALALDNTRLFKLAITDGLTGLYMIRHFRIKLNEEVLRSRRYNKRFALLFLDIDFFKKFNDTYGHQVGDEVLKQVSEIFRNFTRFNIDLPARYGGEEMIAMLPETDSNGAYMIAERLRSYVENYEFRGYKKPLHLTISIGIAEYPLHSGEESDLIRKADTALYESKKTGRNRTTVYDEKMGIASEK